jgi:hypothetical protein
MAGMAKRKFVIPVPMDVSRASEREKPACSKMDDE